MQAFAPDTRGQQSEGERAIREEVRLRRLDGWFEEGELEQIDEDLEDELEEELEDLDYGARGRAR